MNTRLSSLANVAVSDSAPAGESAYRKIAFSPEAIAARGALHEIGKLSLIEQSAASRVMVEIGGVKTFWSRGLAPVPPFIQLHRDGEHLLLVWNEGDSSLHVFHRTPGETRFTPVQVVAKHSVIFSHLPRYAFVPGRCQHPASLAQLVTIRSLLGLEPSTPIPSLHVASATRIIGSIVLEPFLTRLFGAGPGLRADAGVEALVHPNAAPVAGASL